MNQTLLRSGLRRASHGIARSEDRAFKRGAMKAMYPHVAKPFTLRGPEIHSPSQVPSTHLPQTTQAPGRENGPSETQESCHLLQASPRMSPRFGIDSRMDARHASGVTVLAIETSCDETSAAVIRDGCVLSNVVTSQVKLHEEYGGVVPELATREHLKNLPSVLRVALDQAQCLPTDIQKVAATQGPGLPNALMIGVKFAQGFASSLGLPFLGIHHHEAHLYSPWISSTPPRAEWDRFVPNVSLIVSGGHTLLVWVEELLRHQVMGETIDDAAGECFDKIAKLLGLPYPGGPELDRLAAQGNPCAYTFPRPMLHDPGLDFSFSGLKTSVRYFLEKHPQVKTDSTQRADLCAGVQAAIIDVLVSKTLRAAKAKHARCVTVSGGVSCNRGLRSRLEEECTRAGLHLQLALPQMCTDNAAMIGILAEAKWQRGIIPVLQSSTTDVEPLPHWSLAALAAGHTAATLTPRV